MVLKVDVPPTLLCGDVDEGYGPVADASGVTSPSTTRSVRPARSTATATRSSIYGEVIATARNAWRGAKTPWW
jgi:hypothetical protein